MDDKLMYIPNDVKQNYPFCGLKLLFKNYELNKFDLEPTNQYFKSTHNISCL